MLTIHEKKKKIVNQVSYKQIQAFSTKKKKTKVPHIISSDDESKLGLYLK